MAFPDQPRPMLYELQTSNLDWVNVTGDVYALRNTEISDGIPNEYGLSQPATCGFHLNNAPAGDSGRYSPRNPLSKLYKQIGRNTPVRVSIGEGAYGMVTSGIDNSSGRAQTPDSAATSITGDTDIRIDLELLAGITTSNPIGNTSGITSSWLNGNFDIASKWDDTNAARSWTLILIGGKLRFNWFPLGTTASAKFAESITLTGSAQGRRAIRVVLDVDNGASGNNVLFYTAPTMAGPWTQLGSTVTQAGVTSIFDGTAPLRIGGNPVGSVYTYAEPASATYYAAELRNGINGTVVASPDFVTNRPLDPTPFATSDFNDAQGNNWVYAGANDAARTWYGNVDIRFFGEGSSFPNKWDISEADKYVPIEAAGLLRRLGTGSDPAPSGLRDWILSQTNLPTSYFPLSGGSDTTISYNLGRVGPGLKFFPADAPAFSYGKDLGAPWLGSGMEYTLAGNGRMTAEVAAGDDNFALDFVFQSEHLGRLEFWVYDYPGNAWRFLINHDNDDKKITAELYAKDGSVGFYFISAVPMAELSDTKTHTARIMVTSSGGFQNVDIYLDGTLRQSTTTVSGGNNFGPGPSGYQVILGRTGDQAAVNLGHLTIWSFPSAASIPAFSDFDFAARGFAGETAIARMQRVATTGAIPFTYSGTAGETMPMGALYSEPKLMQMRDAETADLGILGERRDALGLHYRTRTSLVDQTPALTLDYAAGHLVPPFEPTDDDLNTRNDMTVSRRDGDSIRKAITSGRLSITEPPVGVGRYHDEATVNVQTDGLLDGIANWLLNAGTVDQPRYPTVTVDLGNLVAAGLDKAARALKFGDLLVIKNMTRVGTYEDVRLMVLGRRSETISDGAYKHTITWNCAPYQAYEGFVWANGASPQTDDARWDTPVSTLASGVSSSATALSVASSAAPWTTDPTAFPLDAVMEGERITVTNIVGTTSPQAFTVVRSVNGVVKAQVAGADIRLAEPSYWSL